MGTRADFYDGYGEDAKWLGSIAYDGYPQTKELQGGIPPELVGAASLDDFCAAVSALLASRKDATTPDQGWPWPWDTSHTTDYAYCFTGGRVRVFCFGKEIHGDDAGELGVFPDMSARKNVTLGARSGLMILRG